MSRRVARSTTAAGVVTKHYKVTDLPAVVTIEAQDAEAVATLRMDAVDDIFGVGKSPEEAVKDLRASLRETCAHLEAKSERLSPRLQEQLKALKMVVAFSRPHTPVTNWKDGALGGGLVAYGDSSTADYSRKFES